LNKKIGVWLGVLILAGLTYWKLQSNKNQIDSEAQLSMVGAAYVPVEVTKPERGALSSKLEVSGIFMPKKEMWVISETAGRIMEVYKDRGYYVR